MTKQVVDEVNRGKVRVAARFLAGQLEKWELKSIAFPEHLLSLTDKTQVSIRKTLREVSEKSKDTKGEFRELIYHVLEQVSQSKDEVSKRLAPVFAKAVTHNEQELQQAMTRWEHGNPPGRRTDPLGDQLSWEQLLGQFQSNRGLWIITGDSDFATKHEGRMFLNATLYKDLVTRLGPAEPVVFCFDNLIPDGLKHFAETNRVKAKKLPTPEEAEQIKKEQESLPPLGWLTDYDDSANYLAVRAHRDRETELMRVAAMTQVPSEQVFSPQVRETDKKGT